MNYNIRLEEELERAESVDKPESYLQLEMERVWRIAREEGGRNVPEISTGELLAALESVDKDSPVVDALHGLVRWERENSYHDGALPSLDSFEEVVRQGVEKEWYNVTLYATVQAVSISSSINDEQETAVWLGKLNSLCRKHWEELSPNTRGHVLDCFSNQHFAADKDLIDEILETLRYMVEEAVQSQNFELQRRILRTIEQILHDRGRTTADVEEEIIESYSSEAQLKQGSPHQRAIILQEALDRCSETAGEDQLNTWKREMREANQKAIEEMPKRRHELDEEEVEQLEQAIDEQVETIRSLKRNENPIAALYTLLGDPAFLPQLDQIDTSEAAPILEIVSTRYMKSEGDAIPDPEERSRPTMYQVGVQHRDNILYAVLRRVFSERIITEGDLYLYLEATDGLTVHDQAYLTDFVTAFFERRFSEALHIGVPRFEGVIASQLKANGYETASLKKGYTTPTPLPGLLNMLEGQVDENLVEYLRYRYSDISGEGLRNKLAHGRLKHQHANHRRCMILLYDIFRTTAWLEDELEKQTD